ncbi:GNAT family N-acetyltransferase [Gemmatimonas sp.]|uniref:GNAT family N-acetyltransferase n=1 Tax=Gemmatimonas sp. TaxID=1962908 RepID=UPI003982E16A
MREALGAGPDRPATVLLLPGLYDSGPEHWQSRWQAQSSAESPLFVERVVQQEWAEPRCADWVARLTHVMQESVHDVVLVAHSTACAMVAHWARGASLEHIMRVRGALLVAPSDPLAAAFPSGPTGFAPVPLTALPFPSTVVASRNDEYVTYEQAERYAAAWGSRVWDVGKAGHINAHAGYGAWPDGWRAVEAMAAAPHCRVARYADVPPLTALIDLSVRRLAAGYYTDAQIASSLAYVFGVDSSLIHDRSYFVLAQHGDLVAAGGWSDHQTLFGGDQFHHRDEGRLHPASSPARIRAFYVHPDHARRGYAKRLLGICSAAAQRAGFTTLSLMSTLPGEPLYRALGFVPDARVEYPMPDGTTLPVIPMTKAIG